MWSEINDYLGGSVRRKRTEPADDLLSDLIATGRLDDGELATMGVMLLVAGHETSANMLARGSYALMRHPDQLNRLAGSRTLWTTRSRSCCGN